MEILIKTSFHNNNLKQARELAGFKTKQELSRASLIWPSALGRYENFKSYPQKGGRNAKLLEKTLKCPYDYLFPPEYIKAVTLNMGKKINEIKTLSLNQLTDKDKNFAITYQKSIIDNTAIEKLLDTLPTREKKLLKIRFGFGDDQPHTLEETAEIFKVTKERIRQIEAKALKKLRRPSALKEIDG